MLPALAPPATGGQLLALFAGRVELAALVQEVLDPDPVNRMQAMGLMYGFSEALYPATFIQAGKDWASWSGWSSVPRRWHPEGARRSAGAGESDKESGPCERRRGQRHRAAPGPAHRGQARRQGGHIELLPGEYRGRCWSDGSLFFDEEVFGFIEPIISRYEPRYDHYSFVGIKRSNWERIITELERLADRVQGAKRLEDFAQEAGFFFTSTAEEFIQDFRVNATTLAGIVRELIAWLRGQLMRHEVVSVLGI